MHRRFRDTGYSITETTISGVHVSQDSAEILVRRGGITNHRSIMCSLSNISAKNHQNQLMWVEVIVCDIGVVFTARRYAKRGICRRRVSVCLSVYVCVCVTIRYCIKTTKRKITQITPHDSAGTLVFWHQNSLRNSNGITPYGADKCRWGGLKFVTFDEKRAVTRKRYKIET